MAKNKAGKSQRESRPPSNRSMPIGDVGFEDPPSS